MKTYFLALQEAAERSLSPAMSDECFWVSGEPEDCELPCEEEADQCGMTPMGSMAPPDMVRPTRTSPPRRSPHTGCLFAPWPRR